MACANDEGARYRTDAEVEDLLRSLESCEITPDAFKHRGHLTAALVYLLRLSEREAHERMRESILRLLRHHRIEEPVYHETITAFWLRRVRAFINAADQGRPLHELASELAESCGDARLIFDYYSKEVIDSEEARAGWVEPDLKAFDF